MKYIAILLLGLCVLPASALQYGTNNVQPYTPTSVLNPQATGNSPADNPYQCPIGDQYILCMGFGGLDEDLKMIINELIQLVTAENSNTAELKKICLVESNHTASEC